jgi:hypothetical protein
VKKFKVGVNAYLNQTYYVEVDAEDVELAGILAKEEVYAMIDPLDIEVELLTSDIYEL